MRFKRVISCFAAWLVLFSAQTALAAEMTGDDIIIAESGRSYGDFEYDVLGSGALEIKRYNGSSETVEVPKTIGGMTVTYIGWNAFKNANSVKHVVIPDSVTAIGKWAFFECKSLESVVIPNSVSSISAYAFSGCSAVREMILPHSLRSIGESAFASCTALENVEVPDGVVSIGEYAFFNCPKLKVRCYPETATMEYCNDNDVQYETMMGMTGDIDGDGSLTAADALVIMRYSVNLTALTPYKKLLADVNSDGTANSADALIVLRSSIKN